MRSALALLGGMGISAAGIGVVVGSEQEMAGVLLIAAGVVAALLGMRVIGAGQSA